MLEVKQKSQLDPAAHTECLEFIRMAIASNDRQTAIDIKNVVAEVYQNGHADRQKIWADLTPSEQNQYRQLLAPPPIVQDFARRILEAVGYDSPGVAAGIDCDLRVALDRAEFEEAELVGVVGDRNFLQFRELAARCPQYF
jgi:hypothetical protein